MTYDVDGIRVEHGNAMELMDREPAGTYDAVVTDPPFGETSLEWDKWPRGWVEKASRLLKPSGSLWCFGSMRMFLAEAGDFDGLRFVQDLVWEKQNGSSFIADRFRRVHEHAVQWVPKASKWADTFKAPVMTNDATARTSRRKKRPAHWGEIESHTYVSVDGGPRLMRSVLAVRNMHGRAQHPTQKPEGIMEPLLRYSVPPGGVVLDPFAGSGTTLVVARSLGMRAVGFEADAGHHGEMVNRLRSTLAL